MSAKTFTVELERVEETAPMVRVPFDLGDASSRARPPLQAATVERVAAGKASA